MSWGVADIPDLTGKVAVVTGANSGLGLETAKALAGARAHVLMGGRDRSKIAQAQEAIRAVHGYASTEVVELDLASLASVERAAGAILDRHQGIDVLVNNAGVMAMPHRRTVDGFEMQFGVNHLGHWALTARLMPAIVAAVAARVVSVTSFARHNASRVDPDDPHLEKGYGPWKAYGQSKLACYHFGIGLQQEFDRRGVEALSLVADPGLSHTNLQVRTVEEGGAGRSADFWRWAARVAGSSQSDGALMQIRAATDLRHRGGWLYSPRFFTRGRPVPRPPRRSDLDRAIETLWEISQRETGLGPFDFVD